MTQILLENAGYKLSVKTQIGQGGLGKASLMGNTNFVFKEPEDIEAMDFEKLRWMIQHPLVASRPGHAFCWPAGIGLHPITQKPVGLLMPAAKEALDSELLRVHWLPDSFCYRALRNAAASLYDLNRAKVIRGDWPNFMVDRFGRVFEVDLDSVGINRAVVQYPVTANKLQTSSPEVLENPDIDITELEDRWGFAICALWLLLAEHPFACQWLGPGDRPSLSDRMKAGMWPHDGKHSDVGPRRGGKPFASLPAELQRYFNRTFSDGHSDPTKRTSAEEWEQIFSKLDKPGDVSLTDAQWQCVADGTIPNTLPKGGRQFRLPRKKELVAAASLALVGTGGYWADEIRTIVPEWPAAFQQVEQAQGRVDERSFAEQVDEIEAIRRKPRVPLHEFAQTHPGATPKLWKHLTN